MAVDVQHAAGNRCHHESVAPSADSETGGVWRKRDQHVSVRLEYCSLSPTKTT